MTKKKVAIIGAGASGLPSIRHALLYGVEPVCFEVTSYIGGLWKYKESERHAKGVQLSSVMKSTIINTSKEMTAYSDFPPHPENGNYMHNREMLQYFEDYAEAYELKKYIKFNHKVESIERADNFADTGRWKVTYQDEDGDNHTEIFDGVMLASGHHSIPHYPRQYPGQAEFQGKLMHSHDYTDYRGFEDKTVVVVGVGNSGVDIAVELSRISKEVYLVSRRGVWILNRLDEGGYPFDASFTTRIGTVFQKNVPSWVSEKMIQNKIEKRFDHAAYGIRPKHAISAAHATLNDEFASRLASRTIKIKPNIAKFKGNDVIFEDLTDAEDVDAVIFATGFWFDFQIVEHGKLIPVMKNEADLYLHMFPVNLGGPNTLGIIGLIQPTGSIISISEMQARVFLSQFVGDTVLPDRHQMEQHVEKTKKLVSERYVKSPRHTIQVDFAEYIEELAELIGCRPSIWKYLWSDFALGQKLLVGALTSYTYRLCGPHPWPKARETILTTEFRIKAGMAPEGESSSMSRNLELYMQPNLPSLPSILFAAIFFILVFKWLF